MKKMPVIEYDENEFKCDCDLFLMGEWKVWAASGYWRDYKEGDDDFMTGTEARCQHEAKFRLEKENPYRVITLVHDHFDGRKGRVQW